MLRLTREASESRCVTLFVRPARWAALADDGLLGKSGLLAASVNATFFSWAFRIRSATDSYNY